MPHVHINLNKHARHPIADNACYQVLTSCNEITTSYVSIIGISAPTSTHQISIHQDLELRTCLIHIHNAGKALLDRLLNIIESTVSSIYLLKEGPI